MRLILRDEIDNLGRRGDVVNVKRGYARNFLIPQRLAMEVTEENLRIVEKEKKIYEEKLAKEKVVADAVAEKLAPIKLAFERKAHGEGDELYGSVTPTDVAEALEQKGFSIEKRRIALSEPIKSLGEYTVSIKLHPEVSVDLPLTVERDGEPEPPAPPTEAAPADTPDEGAHTAED